MVQSIWSHLMNAKVARSKLTRKRKYRDKKTKTLDNFCGLVHLISPQKCQSCRTQTAQKSEISRQENKTLDNFHGPVQLISPQYRKSGGTQTAQKSEISRQENKTLNNFKGPVHLISPQERQSDRTQAAQKSKITRQEINPWIILWSGPSDLTPGTPKWLDANCPEIQNIETRKQNHG